MKKNITILMLIISLAAVDAFARQKRVGQVPNGSKFGCLNCHFGQGGPRNVFGLEIESNHLDSNGDVIWSAALAALDSDNDGKTNGEELQDPNGVWRIGDAAPGDVNLVSKPGDPSSTTGVQFAAFGLPTSMHLRQNYPNPFNPLTTITFAVPSRAEVRLTIYNSLGQPIRELVNGQVQSGDYAAVWNGLNDSGEFVGSGVYLARLESESFSQTIRMLMMK